MGKKFNIDLQYITKLKIRLRTHILLYELFIFKNTLVEL